MAHRISHVNENGKAVPFIDISKWKSLENEILKSSPENRIVDAVKRGVDSFVIDQYRNSESSLKPDRDSYTPSELSSQLTSPKIIPIPTNELLDSRTYSQVDLSKSYQARRSMGTQLNASYSSPLQMKNPLEAPPNNRERIKYALSVTDESGKPYVDHVRACARNIDFCLGYC